MKRRARAMKSARCGCSLPVPRARACACARRRDERLRPRDEHGSYCCRPARARARCPARGGAMNSVQVFAFRARVAARRAQVSIWPWFRHTGCAQTIVKRSVLPNSERFAIVPARPCVHNRGETCTVSQKRVSPWFRRARVSETMAKRSLVVQICETVVTCWIRRGGPVVTPGTRGSKNGPGYEGIDAQTDVFLFWRKTMVGRARDNRGRGFPLKTEPLQLARLFI